MTDEELDTLWTHVLARWDEASVHALFVESCRLAAKLGLAAKKYRDVATPGGASYREDARAEEAKKRLSSIMTLAMLDLEAIKSPAPEKRGAPKLLVVVVLLFAVVGAAILYMFDR